MANQQNNQIRPRRIPEAHLKEFPDLRKQGHVSMVDKIWVLDGNVFETASFRHIEEIVKRGNFQICEDVVNEIMDWPKQSDKARAAVRAKSQLIVNEIRKKHKDKIVAVDKEDIYNELTKLEPLLSKTIAVTQIVEALDKDPELPYKLNVSKSSIEIIRKSMKDNINRIAKSLFNGRRKMVREAYGIDITNPDEDFNIFKVNLKISIDAVMNDLVALLSKGYGPQRIKRDLLKKHENDVKVDKSVVAHHLASRASGLKTIIATRDKDLVELVGLMRRRKAV